MAQKLEEKRQSQQSRKEIIQKNERNLVRRIKQNAQKDEEKVKNTLAVKVEEVNLQREKNELKRLEQRENYLKIKKEHQEKMLNL